MKTIERKVKSRREAYFHDRIVAYGVRHLAIGDHPNLTLPRANRELLSMIRKVMFSLDVSLTR